MKTKKVKKDKERDIVDVIPTVKKGKNAIKPIKEKKLKKGKKSLKKVDKGKVNKKANKKLKFIEDYDDSHVGRNPVESFEELELDLDPQEMVDLAEEHGQLPPTPMKMSKVKEVRKVKKVKSPKFKKKVKIPKIRRPATSENVEENYMIVPWESSEEWNEVSRQLHCSMYPEVISKIAVWQRRVPNLPVGVEATLFLLEALLYDRKLLHSSSNADRSGLYTEDQARALYSLSIIRYLNHVNHLAAQSLGEASSRPAQELAAMMDTPDWLVTLRNNVSHGPKAPSLELLRMGGNFVLQWLKVKYWKLPEAVEAADANINDPFTILGQDNELDVPLEISRLLQAYVATRIYKRRYQNVIRDPEIISLTTPSADSLPVIKTKLAVTSLKSSLRRFLLSNPSVFCVSLSQELIPSAEFYEEFVSMFRKKSKGGDSTEDSQGQSFEHFYAIWMPIIKMVEVKGKLLPILTNLCEVMVDEDSEKIWMLTARWIDKILEIIEMSGKKYSRHLVGLLRGLIKHPNSHMRLFLERLFRLTEPRIGADAVRKLECLVNIWLEGEVETRKQRKFSSQKLFSLTDVEGQNCSNEVDDYDDMTIIAWEQDRRGEEFWRNIPLGGSF